MSRPHKHPRTGVFWFRRRVPADLIPVIGKREITQTLGTKDPAQAKIEHSRINAKVDAQWLELRKGVQSLSHKQAHALAGDVYRVWVKVFSENPGPPERWERILAEDDHAMEAETWSTLAIGLTASEVRVRKMEKRYGPILRSVLAGRGMLLDPPSYRRALEAFAMAMRQASSQLERNSRGDYRPDPDGTRFPDITVLAKPQRQPVVKTDEAALRFSSLIAAWSQEKRPVAKTLYSWSRTLEAFGAFLGHDDASRVTADDVIRWKAHLLSQGLNPKTVRDSKLAPLKAIFQVAVGNRLLTQGNPCEGVSVASKAAPSERKRGYTDTEAQAVLGASLRSSDPVRRWIPWVCAFTGARVAEVCQLRREDIVEVDSVTCIRITPEAGSVKNAGSERLVPLHPALASFASWARSRPPGPLFATLTPDRFGSRGGNGTKLLSRWIRDEVGITDTRIAPSHAWRHRFKTLCRLHGIPPDYHDAITGHAAGSEGQRYGEYPMPALLREIEKIPSR